MDHAVELLHSWPARAQATRWAGSTFFRPFKARLGSRSARTTAYREKNIRCHRSVSCYLSLNLYSSTLPHLDRDSSGAHRSHESDRHRIDAVVDTVGPQHRTSSRAGHKERPECSGTRFLTFLILHSSHTLAPYQLTASTQVT